MYVVHGTKKFLERVGGQVRTESAASTSRLGCWYATVLFWKPQVALFVNETTLLPVFVPLAPAASVIGRFPAALGEVLSAHGVAGSFIAEEMSEMAEVALAKTANRSVVGIVNEFSYLGGVHRDGGPVDLVELSLRLSATPCSPLYGRHTSPDRELMALVSSVS